MVCVCVFVFVCDCKRERQRQRETERERDRETERESERGRVGLYVFSWERTRFPNLSHDTTQSPPVCECGTSVCVCVCVYVCVHMRVFVHVCRQVPSIKYFGIFRSVRTQCYTGSLNTPLRHFPSQLNHTHTAAQPINWPQTGIDTSCNLKS